MQTLKLKDKMNNLSAAAAFPSSSSPMAHLALSLTQVTGTARVRMVDDPIACHGMELSVILARKGCLARRRRRRKETTKKKGKK